MGRTAKEIPSIRPPRLCQLARTVLLLLLLVIMTGQASGGNTRIFGLHDLKNLSLPLGQVADQPTAFFRCGSVTTEKRRLGILQLGLHPRWVFRDVELEITAHGSGSEGLRDIAAFFAAEPFLHAGRMERFVVRNKTSGIVVTARSAGYGGGSPEQFLLLQDVKIEQPGGKRTILPVGRFFLAGARAGFVVGGPNPDLTIDLSR